MDSHQTHDRLLSQDEPPTSRTTKPEPKPWAARIHRSTYVIWLVVFYAMLMLFSWIVTCTLTYRPITTSHYGLWVDGDDYEYNVYSSTPVMESRYNRNERWYRAARVIQAVANVLTIPLTSTVCSNAVVVYLQHCTQRGVPDITLRQMMVLADRGWTDMPTYLRLFAGHWKRYGSAFLAWAVLLHILGGIISPLQQIFLSTENVKSPTFPIEISPLLDLSDKFATEYTQEAWYPVVVVTRKALESTSGNDSPSQLWTSKAIDCVDAEGKNNDTHTCSVGGITWGNISILANPFLAQLPSDFNTGLVQQFLPRFNSTAQYDNISEVDFPTDCDTRPGALSIRYSNTTIDSTNNLTWAVHACMPADLRTTPWRNTRARQDFTEELYLNITLSSNLRYAMRDSTSGPEVQLFRVTVNTTAGYFELPNYMNQKTPGPLLSHDPNAECGNACLHQGFGESSIYDHNQSASHPVSRRESNLTAVDDLAKVNNKGPLLTTTLALFGRNSWLESVSRYPRLYDHDIDETSGTLCVDLVPFGRILTIDKVTEQSLSTNDLPFSLNDINRCIDPEDPAPQATFNNAIRAGLWLQNFRVDTNTMSNAFTIAAYLANWVWMTHEGPFENSLSVTYDMGADHEKPSISLAGIILLSILIGVDLLALLLTAVYASWFPRWTDHMDAFSLLRVGGTLGEKVPLMTSNDNDKITVLDELPGWVGDQDPDGRVGRISLGGEGRLKRLRDYETYRPR